MMHTHVTRQVTPCLKAYLSALSNGVDILTDAPPAAPVMNSPYDEGVIAWVIQMMHSPLDFRTSVIEILAEQ
jgi:hypothetical protein